METKLRELAQRLLATAEVDLIIGYGKNTDGSAEPVFVTKDNDALNLIWNRNCYNNLAVYLTKDFVKKAKKVGITAKGCDIKAIVGLIQENQVTKDKLIIIGLACEGAGETPLEKCKYCDVKTPKLYDYLIPSQKSPGFNPGMNANGCVSASGREPRSLDQEAPLGDPVKADSIENKYADVEEFEKKSDEEKKAYWDKVLSKCIKCYACRAACPLCYCSRCIVEKNQPQWVPTSSHSHGNFAWNFIRSFHLAGRCIGCGECERACPVGIPLGLINKKSALEIKRNFGYEAGYDFKQNPPLVCFNRDDNNDFIK